jgi:hypothetical protein
VSVIHQRRVPVEGVIRVGEVHKIAHVLTRDDAFTAATVVVNFYDSAGALYGTANQAGTASPGTSATEQEISILWTPAAAGDYRYQMTAVCGSETIACRDSLYVLPVVSKYDRWIEAVQGIAQTAAGGEEEQRLSTRDLIRAIDAARRRYQRDWPQRKLNHASGVVMTADDWEYALPSDWADGFSQILQFEYPVDATIQSRAFLDPTQYAVDPLRSVWVFNDINPSTGYYARFTYTAEHVLSHTADTLPSHHFDAIATWAAGEALEYLANEATRTDSRTVAADAVNYRTKQQERRSQAATLKAQAVQMWANPVWSL